MAEVLDATLTPGKVDLVAGWIGRQRWYAAKGQAPRLTRLRGFRFDDPAGDHDWGISATVDLAESAEAGIAVVRVTAVGMTDA